MDPIDVLKMCLVRTHYDVMVSAERVKVLHASGAALYVWSAGGSDYARSTAEELGIVYCFAGFLPKPNLILDDMPVSEWPNCKHEYPG